MRKTSIAFLFFLSAHVALADEWRMMPGRARDVAIGANGKTFVVGNIPREFGYSIHSWSGTAWTDVEGGAVRIAVDPAGNPWIVDNRNKIFRRESNRWVELPGTAEDIGIGADGSVWIIGTAIVPGGNSIYYWMGTAWSMVLGGGKKISVGPNGQPFIVKSTGAIQERLADGRWATYPGTAKDISVGVNGNTWIIGNESRDGSFSIHRWNANAWEAVDGGGTQIAVDPAGMPLIVNHLFEIFKRTRTRPVYRGVYSITPITHEYPYSGKIESIAADPTNPNRLMVASVGGVFETGNANSSARRWEQNTDFNNPYVMNVLYSGIPSYTLAWAAVVDDFSAGTIPQIWEKRKNGRWTPAEFVTGTALQAEKTGAYRVVNGPSKATFYACGDFGVASYGIGGLWKIFTVNPGLPVYSIAVLKNGTIAAGTADGIYVFSQSQNRWVLTNRNVKFPNGGLRYQLNTDFTGQVLLAADVSGGSGIHYSTDGVNWSSFSAPPDYTGAAGGFYSVYLDSLVAGKYTLLISDRYKVYQADITAANPVQALRSLRPGTPVGWSAPFTSGHDDTREFLRIPAGEGRSRAILTSDGGFHSSIIDYARSGNYTWETDKPSSGLNNLEVYNLTGAGNTVNFGTQHNSFGALNERFELIGSGLNEGYVISRRGLGDTDPRVIVFAPDPRIPQSLSVQGPAFGTAAYSLCGTPDPYWKGPNDGWGNPIWVGGRIYIQDARPTEGRPGVYPWKISVDNGCTWQSLPDGNAERKGMNACFSTDSNGVHHLFVGLAGSSGVKLGKLVNPSIKSRASWSYPSMRGISGGIAFMGADFLYLPVFSVNPTDPGHILAVEANTGKLKETRTGGDRWADAESFNQTLTVTHAFPLKGKIGLYNVRSIAFSPFDSNIILVGTAKAGLFISVNGGQTWSRHAKPGLLNISDFFWRTPQNVIISTYGHGLFNMTM